MFHKLFFIFCICLTSSSFSLFASPRASYGYQFFGRGTVESVNVCGTAYIEGTTVEADISVNGSVSMRGARAGSLQVNGPVKMKDSVVLGASIIHGPLHAERSTFKEALTLATSSAVLRGCVLESLHIKKDNESSSPQVIDLRGTTLSGTIVFERGNGEVLVSPDSAIRPESIRGATLKVVR